MRSISENEEKRKERIYELAASDGATNHPEAKKDIVSIIQLLRQQATTQHKRSVGRLLLLLYICIVW
jgi:hypothetical protein